MPQSARFRAYLLVVWRAAAPILQDAFPIPDLVSADAYDLVAQPTWTSASAESWSAAGQVPGKLYEGVEDLVDEDGD
jgi:hypothetical protein